MREEIEKEIKKGLSALNVPEELSWIMRPGSFFHGDYYSNAPIVAFKCVASRLDSHVGELLWLKTQTNDPRSFAENWAAHLNEIQIPGIEKVEAAGPGFLNFFLTGEAIAQEVQKAATNPAWGFNELYKDKRVMVEYTDPNPFKEFHIGHLMSNAIGESIARLLEYSGAHVLRANYQGDVGLHVAKAIWGKQQKPTASWGEAYVYGSEQYEAHKEEIDSLNKIIYEKTDPLVNALYDGGRAEALRHFENIYKALGTTFAYYFFESETGPKGLGVVAAHPDVFEKGEGGAIVFKGEPYGLHTRVFVNSKGLPTYEAKELGLVEAKKEKGTFDMSLTVTANETREYFKVVRKAAELVFPDLEGKMLTRFHGFLKLTTGKMSSRLGNVITGESLLVEIEAKALERIGERTVKEPKKVAEQVAVGAIKYAVLKQGSGKDIIFDPEKSLSLEGDSGPYLQYARVRALSLIAKARLAEKSEKAALFASAAGQQGDASANNAAFSLDRILIHFPDVLERAAQELEPHYVTTYLTELASAFNSWYASERVIVEGRVDTDKLQLVEAVERTLKEGLTVIGIPAPEEM